MGKRYGNAVLFALPMIGDEVHPLDLLLIEAMRIFFPRLYEWVRTHEEEAIGKASLPQHQVEGADAALREAVVEATAGMTEEEVRGAVVLLTTLFPRTQSAWKNMHWGSDWDTTWAKGRRITSSQYFRRYFTYTVPAGDMRDADVDTLIAWLEDPDHDGGEVADFAAHLIESASAETFLLKVGARIDAVSSQAAARLVALLAGLSDLLPDQSVFLGLSTLERAALLAAKLVERLAPEERLDLVSAVVKASPSIPFAVEVLRWSRPRDDEVKTLTLEETAEAGRLLVGRIAPLLEGDDPFGSLGRRLAGTLHVWSLYGEAAELRARLASLIAADLSNAFRLMGAFLGQAWSMDTGAPLMPEFRREAYNALVEYIDADDLFSGLQQRFGEAVGTGELYGFRNLPPEERLANEFAFIHRAVWDEERSKDEASPEEAQE